MLWNSDQKDEAEVFWKKIAELEPTNPILQSLPQQESQEIMEESTTNSSDSEVSTQHPEHQTEEESRPVIEGDGEADKTDSIALEDSLVVLIQNARKYSEGGEHSTAVQTWKTIIEQYGSTSESWHGMADALEVAGHFQKSDQCRLKAEELESSKSEHEAQTAGIKEVDLIAAAQIVIQKVQPTEDIGDDDVNTSIEWYNKGLSLLAENKGVEALQCFEKTVSSAPREEKELRVRAHNGRGNALHQLGQYAESIQSYHQAISMDPTMVTGRTMYNMGSSYAAMEHFQDAVSCFEQALERDLEEEENLLCRTQLNRCMLLLKEQQKLDRLRA
jgi:tetratricopeptide (TPR) repeat protein